MILTASNSVRIFFLSVEILITRTVVVLLFITFCIYYNERCLVIHINTNYSSITPVTVLRGPLLQTTDVSPPTRLPTKSQYNQHPSKRNIITITISAVSQLSSQTLDLELLTLSCDLYFHVSWSCDPYTYKN